MKAKTLGMSSALLLLLADATVHAADNLAHIEQVGNNNNAWMIQQGTNLKAKLQQEHDGNTAHFKQLGADSVILGFGGGPALQSGYDNRILIEQVGVRNKAFANQQGMENAISLGQYGDYNTARVGQYGDYNTAGVQQYGNGNTANLQQFGNGNQAIVTQSGGSSLQLSQEGDNNAHPEVIQETSHIAIHQWSAR